jgi:hypothetical protein
LKVRHQILLVPNRISAWFAWHAGLPYNPIVSHLDWHTVDEIPDHCAVMDQWWNDCLATFEYEFELIVFNMAAYTTEPRVFTHVVHVVKFTPRIFRPSEAVTPSASSDLAKLWRTYIPST